MRNLLALAQKHCVHTRSSDVCCLTQCLGDGAVYRDTTAANGNDPQAAKGHEVIGAAQYLCPARHV